MFVQLATGSLPWESAASLADLHQRKANLPLADLCSDCPGACAASVFRALSRRVG